MIYCVVILQGDVGLHRLYIRMASNMSFLKNLNHCNVPLLHISSIKNRLSFFYLQVFFASSRSTWSFSHFTQ